MPIIAPVPLKQKMCPTGSVACYGRLEPREEAANALGIHAHIAATDPRHGADVQPASTLVRRDPDHDIVCEAEEQAGVRSFEASLLRLDGNDLPSHIARHPGYLCEEGGGGKRQ